MIYLLTKELDIISSQSGIRHNTCFVPSCLCYARQPSALCLRGTCTPGLTARDSFPCVQLERDAAQEQTQAAQQAYSQVREQYEARRTVAEPHRARRRELREAANSLQVRLGPRSVRENLCDNALSFVAPNSRAAARQAPPIPCRCECLTKHPAFPPRTRAVALAWLCCRMCVSHEKPSSQTQSLQTQEDRDLGNRLFLKWIRFPS